MRVRGKPSSVIVWMREVLVLVSVRFPASAMFWKFGTNVVVTGVTVRVVSPETLSCGKSKIWEDPLPLLPIEMPLAPLTVSAPVVMVALVLLRKSRVPPLRLIGFDASALVSFTRRVPPVRLRVPLSAPSVFTVRLPPLMRE